MSEKSRGDCHHCRRPVYSTSNAMTSNAGFTQDPYGPEGYGTWYHMTCRRRHLDKKRTETAPKADALPMLPLTLVFMLLLLGSLILNVILIADP